MDRGGGGQGRRPIIGGSDGEDILANAGQVKVMRDSDNTQNWFNMERISSVSCWKTIKASLTMVKGVISMKIVSKTVLKGAYQLQLSTADLHFCPCLCPRQ